MASDRLPQGIPNRNDHCTHCGTGFSPGSPIWSYLKAESPQSRQDLCATCWNSLPRPGTFWWKTLFTPVAEKELAKKREERLLEMATGTEPVDLPESDSQATPEFQLARRYAAALALWRLRRLRLEQVAEKDGREVLVFRMIGTQKRFEAIHPGLSDAQLRTMEEDLLRQEGDGISPDLKKAA